MERLDFDASDEMLLRALVGVLAASGNYVLQRMLEYAATHRAEGGTTESFFTAIVRSFCREKGLVMAALDNRGTFSVQKMVSVHSPFAWMHGSATNVRMGVLNVDEISIADGCYVRV